MPARTPSTTNKKGVTAETNQSIASNPSRNDDEESGGTEPALHPVIHREPAGDPSALTDREPTADKTELKKLQKSTSMSTTIFPPGPERQGNVAPKQTFTSRRRQSSIPSMNGPVGPRALNIPAGKRSTSNSQFNTISGASAVASQDPYTHQLSINDISRFSFASITPQKPSPQNEQKDPLDFGDFLSPISFDDFHNSITTTEPSLSHFPLPGRGGVKRGQEQEEKRLTGLPSIPVPTTRNTSGPLSIGRKGSTASVNRLPAKPEPTSMTGNSVLRGRRQSHFPPNAFHNPVAKAPRKSVGPGTFIPPETPENLSPSRKASIGGRKSSGEKQKDTALSVRLVNRGANPPASKDMRATASPNRSAKTKSLLEPRSQHNDLLTPSRTPDHTRSRSSSTNTALTPNRASRSGTPGRTNTPGAVSTGNRRMSTMPPHAKGLGARTISPTDARRMRRMSTMPPAPPLPQTRLSQAPPTPQPELPPLRPRSTVQSPGPTTRKSITPSSSRTTPDPNRKSYSSGQSLSSSTSYGSVRNSTVLPPRHLQLGSSSRLPTPKPRLDTGATPTGEEVPPVPAIPKAYESPQSEIDQPFFSARSSSLPPFDVPLSDGFHGIDPADAMQVLETPRPPSSLFRRSNGFIHVETEPRLKQQSETGVKKNFAALRLPPLNILPLGGTTMTAKKDSKTPTDDRLNTPPPRRANIKTPSTPMTASKASFFSRSHKQVDDDQTNFMRSNTSHHALRFGTDEQRPPSSSSTNLPPFAFEGASNNTRNISPYISSSLPKSSGEFGNYMRSNFGSEFNRTPQARPSGPRSPSFSVTPKAEPKESPVETESVFSAAALRRKLSRKRSESRTRENNEKESDTAKYDNMPPPKLPASATWGNLTGKSSSPTQRPNYLKSRRKTSASSVNVPPGPDRQDSFGSIQSSVTEGRPSTESARGLMHHNNRSVSTLATAQNLVAHKSNAQLRSSDSSLDRDDMAAEEEMKKLASKRKDFESAARELDALRKRARPVDRMSAGYAQQTVNLNIFERGEIVDYADIFFTGTRSAKKIVGDNNVEPVNFGYDDERGDYNIVEGDHLAYRYEVVDLLGKGSFGQVVRCVDHKTGILVAVKIIRNKKRFHQQALVEVNILKKLREWDPNSKHSVVNFDQSFYFRGHLCISTDLLDMNLYEFIKAHDFRGFSLKLIRRFTKQLLSSLILLHGRKVIHCDLKPENILLAHPIHSEIKVIDFGSSCFENEKVYTYIQSRFYRSPEVILGMSYGMPIDMWSLGCILAELYTGYPIFPGENEQEQLACIMEVFGPPEKHLIEKSTRKKLFFDSMGKPRLTVSSKGRRRRPSSKELRQVLKCDDEAFLDFIARCLRWDPARRMNPHEANIHEFVTGVKINTNGARKHMANGAASSPIKRVNSVTANGSARPLPQPPGTSLKNGVVMRQDSFTSSPNRRAPRLSTMNGLQNGSNAAKRASHAAALTASNSSTNLTRVTNGQRTVNGRPDLATAAAAASLVR